MVTVDLRIFFSDGTIATKTVGFVVPPRTNESVNILGTRVLVGEVTHTPNLSRVVARLIVPEEAEGAALLQLDAEGFLYAKEPLG